MAQWETETCGSCKEFKRLSDADRAKLAETIAASPTLRASEEVRRCVIDKAGAPRIPENAACGKWEEK
jgi:hypothetical protein